MASVAGSTSGSAAGFTPGSATGRTASTAGNGAAVASASLQRHESSVVAWLGVGFLSKLSHCLLSETGI